MPRERYGAAKLRPFSRRQHGNRTALNVQFTGALDWWIDVLRCPVAPREMSCNLQHLPHDVSYSDGEGSDAGVGVAVWEERGP